MDDGSSSYWKEYTNLQFTKHKIIREYLNGWFPKLGLWAGNLLYLDTHAGRGKHSSGQEGSPLIALKTLLQHQARQYILEKSLVEFLFIERDQTNCQRLENELRAIKYPSLRIKATIINCDSFKFIDNLYKRLEVHDMQMCPCFMFIDPFGFKIPCELLQRVMRYSRSELLITVMWRELDMALMNRSKSEALIRTLDHVFGSDRWQEICSGPSSDARAEAAAHLLRDLIGAKWYTYIKMLDNGRTRYLLLHLTNHHEGKDLIKNVLWNCSPEAGWFARKSDDPRQYLLFKPEPDLTSLENWVIEKLSSKSYAWDELVRLLREEIWLNKHLWQVLRKFRNTNRLAATKFTGRFSQSANPTFSLSKY